MSTILRRYGDARMTGSGACCFVAFTDEDAAQDALLSLPGNMKGQVVRGLASHPLSALT